MTNRIAFILALSFSFLFGVDTPKEIDSQSQIITEIQFDADAFQQNQLIKKGIIETYKQARKAKSIPKPAGSPIYISNQKSGKTLKKETSAKKVLKGEVHLEKRENAKQKLNELRAISEEYRQKKEMSETDKKAFTRMGHSQQPKTNRVNFKQKLNELRAQAKAGNTTVTHDAMRKIKFNHQTSTRSRSRSIGTEFEFETIANLYEAFGYVLATEGSGCDGCPGNLNEMEDVASFPIFRQDSFEAWASDSGFTAYYFQFIDENETGEYDDGEIYAVSCEGSANSNNMTVAYNGSVYNLDFVDFWMEAYDFDWDNTDDDDFFIEGIVRDFDGNPISGAEVIVADGIVAYSELTNEDGYYFIDLNLLEITGAYLIAAWDENHWGQVTTFANYENETQFDFMLGLVAETTSLNVWAMTSNGDPVSFAEVHSPQSPQGMSVANWDGAGYITVYPSDGFADIDGFSEEYGEAYAQLEGIEAGMAYTVDLIFEDDSTGGGDYFIEGIVRDFDGNPISGVFVNAFNEEIDVVGYAEADEEGYYHINIDSPNGIMALVSANDTNNVYWSDFTMVDVSEGGNQFDFSLGLIEETAIIGVVAMTSNGDPVSFAQVISPQSPQNMSFTDWYGWDVVTVDPSEGFADIYGFSNEYGDAYAQVNSIETTNYYEVILFFEDDSTGGDFGVIYGSVQDMDGWGIPYADVQAWNYDHWYAVTTDENGNFSMEVPAGYYDMEAWASGYFSEWNWVEVYPNDESWVEFYLYQENDYNTLVHGHVQDEDGNPLSFAIVNASYLYDDWESEGTFTNEDGYYELYLYDDAYRISAGAEGFWVSAYDSIYVGGDSLWLDFELSSVGEFDGGWQGNVNLVGNYDPEMIFLGIMSEDYQVFRILYEPGPQEIDLVNGSYHLIAGADGYQEVFIPNAINIENNVVQFDIHLVQEGLLLPPQIEFAGDVPNDQGRQMRLVWNPGVPGDWGYFEFFSIWRQVNEAPMILWDFIDVVPWHGMESYSAVVPTLGDSTDMGIYWSTFRVTGHTENPNEFYDSAPVSGYSIDNLHPGAPGGVQAFTGGEGILLTWDSSMDEDFGFHRIYRHNTDSGDPAIEFTTVDTFYVDDVAEGNYEYWITAVDLNGNESDPSIIVTVTLAIDNGLAVPMEFALQQNYPNPFNPNTQIQYALPTDANVTIAIYDLVGRQIRTLVNEQVTAGFHSTLWNATNDMGSPVSAGVYIYTITANDFRDVKKMILLK